MLRRRILAPSALRTIPRCITPRAIFLARTMVTTSHLDVTHEIRIDHDNVRDLFERYNAAITPLEREEIANTLIREMAVHSDAEEISIYNDYAKYGLEADAAHNREEHAEIKRLVYAADNAIPGINEPENELIHDITMAKAVDGFLSHALEEERVQLPKLKSKLSPEESDKLARAFLKARMRVPERPHPMAPRTGGVLQQAADVQARLHDKIIDTLSDRKFVEVKYKHPEVHLVGGDW